MEYALNTLNVVSQLTVPIGRGLQDGLSHIVDVAAPLQRLAPHNRLPQGVPSDVSLALIVGLSVFVVGYVILRRM
ncbi:MAG TPA: hypothetical protein VJT33_02925 [bacterium]|nr:hypothetical protein [bacterium]